VSLRWGGPRGRESRMRRMSSCLVTNPTMRMGAPQGGQVSASTLRCGPGAPLPAVSALGAPTSQKRGHVNVEEALREGLRNDYTPTASSTIRSGSEAASRRRAWSWTRIWVSWFPHVASLPASVEDRRAARRSGLRFARTARAGCNGRCHRCHSRVSAETQGASRIGRCVGWVEGLCRRPRAPSESKGIPESSARPMPLR